jgi:hypothetical protein
MDGAPASSLVISPLNQECELAFVAYFGDEASAADNTATPLGSCRLRATGIRGRVSLSKLRTSVLGTVRQFFVRARTWLVEIVRFEGAKELFH